MLAGGACGAGSAALAVFASPIAGILAATVCTAAFGAHATNVTKDLTTKVLEVLHPQDAQKLAEALKPPKPAKKKP